MDAHRQPATYLLQIRRSTVDNVAELTSYLAWLSAQIEVILADGSPVPAFKHHHREWSALVRHVAPIEALRSAKGRHGGSTVGSGWPPTTG